MTHFRIIGPLLYCAWWSWWKLIRSTLWLVSPWISFSVHLPVTLRFFFPFPDCVALRSVTFLFQNIDFDLTNYANVLDMPLLRYDKNHLFLLILSVILLLWTYFYRALFKSSVFLVAIIEDGDASGLLFSDFLQQLAPYCHPGPAELLHGAAKQVPHTACW